MESRGPEEEVDIEALRDEAPKEQTPMLEEAPLACECRGWLAESPRGTRPEPGRGQVAVSRTPCRREGGRPLPSPEPTPGNPCSPWEGGGNRNKMSLTIQAE